jgi:hypothetical protein
MPDFSPLRILLNERREAAEKPKEIRYYRSNQILEHSTSLYYTPVKVCFASNVLKTQAGCQVPLAGTCRDREESNGRQAANGTRYPFPNKMRLVAANGRGMLSIFAYFASRLCAFASWRRKFELVSRPAC